MVVLQMMVPQINLLIMLRRASPFAFLPRSLLLARASLLVPRVPVWQLGPARLEVLFSFALVQLAAGLGGTKGKISSSSASRSRFSLAGSFLDAGPTSGLSSSSSSSCMSGAWAGYAGFSLSHGKGYMSPWVTRSLTQLGRWLIRKIRQVQHNVSHRGVLSWRRIQTKSWTCNFVSFWIQFTGHTQVFHLRER